MLELLNTKSIAVESLLILYSLQNISNVSISEILYSWILTLNILSSEMCGNNISSHCRVLQAQEVLLEYLDYLVGRDYLEKM